MLAFWGAVLLALVVVSISNIFSIEGKKKVALTHLHTTNKAAKAIQASMRYFLAKKKLHMFKYKNGDIDMDNGFLKMMQALSTSASTANYIRTAATTNSLSMESSAIYEDSDEDY